MSEEAPGLTTQHRHGQYLWKMMSLLLVGHQNHVDMAIYPTSRKILKIQMAGECTRSLLNETYIAVIVVSLCVGITKSRLGPERSVPKQDSKLNLISNSDVLTNIVGT